MVSPFSTCSSDFHVKMVDIVSNYIYACQKGCLWVASDSDIGEDDNILKGNCTQLNTSK